MRTTLGAGRRPAVHNGIPDLGFRFLYVGHADVQWDDAFGLGLLYMHARHYSPTLGRFLQPDPSRAETTAYAYTGNNPTSRIDPSGKLWWLIPIAIMAIRVAATVIAAAPVVQKIATNAQRILPTVQTQITQLQHIISRHTWAHAPDGASVFLKDLRWWDLIRWGGYGRFEQVKQWVNGNWQVVNIVRFNGTVGYEAVRLASGEIWYRATDTVTFVWRNGMLWTMHPGVPWYLQ